MSNSLDHHITHSSAVLEKILMATSAAQSQAQEKGPIPIPTVEVLD